MNNKIIKIIISDETNIFIREDTLKTCIIEKDKLDFIDSIDITSDSITYTKIKYKINDEEKEIKIDKPPREIIEILSIF